MDDRGDRDICAVGLEQWQACGEKGGKEGGKQTSLSEYKSLAADGEQIHSRKRGSSPRCRPIHVLFRNRCTWPSRYNAPILSSVAWWVLVTGHQQITVNEANTGLPGNGSGPWSGSHQASLGPSRMLGM